MKNNVFLVAKEKKCKLLIVLIGCETGFLHLHSAMKNSILPFDKHCNSKHNGIW